jgi:threonine/homoserine/homoserine lactone efflux protein
VVPGIQDLGLFVVAGLLLNVSPGPDTLYIAGRAATQGFRAGAVAALGIAAGCFVHIAAAAVGLSALVMASAEAFLVIKMAGAAYLVYVGATLLLARGAAAADEPQPRLAPAPMSTIFWQGCLTNALNPKVALFFLAFLPQFIDAHAPHKALAFAILGVVFNVNGTFWNLFVAWSADRMAGGLRRGRAALWVNRAIGACFVAMGVRLALLDRG